MKFKLFGLYFTEKTKWSDEDLNLFIEINLHIGMHIPFFAVCVPDKTFCHANIFTALLRALECETVASAKYTRLKDRVRDIGAWQKL